MKAPYKLIYDTPNFIDGICCESLEAAKNAAIDVYTAWMEAEMATWKSETLTAEEIDSWNYMVCECCCYIVAYDPETDEYTDAANAYFLSDAELEEIGWKELPEPEEQ